MADSRNVSSGWYSGIPPYPDDLKIDGVDLRSNVSIIAAMRRLGILQYNATVDFGNLPDEVVRPFLVGILHRGFDAAEPPGLTFIGNFDSPQLSRTLWKAQVEDAAALYLTLSNAIGLDPDLAMAVWESENSGRARAGYANSRLYQYGSHEMGHALHMDPTLARAHYQIETLTEGLPRGASPFIGTHPDSFRLSGPYTLDYAHTSPDEAIADLGAIAKNPAAQQALHGEIADLGNAIVRAERDPNARAKYMEWLIDQVATPEGHEKFVDVDPVEGVVRRRKLRPVQYEPERSWYVQDTSGQFFVIANGFIWDVTDKVRSPFQRSRAELVHKFPIVDMTFVPFLPPNNMWRLQNGRRERLYWEVSQNQIGAVRTVVGTTRSVDSFGSWSTPETDSQKSSRFVREIEQALALEMHGAFRPRRVPPGLAERFDETHTILWEPKSRDAAFPTGVSKQIAPAVQHQPSFCGTLLRMTTGKMLFLTPDGREATEIGSAIAARSAGVGVDRSKVSSQSEPPAQSLEPVSQRIRVQCNGFGSEDAEIIRHDANVRTSSVSLGRVEEFSLVFEYPMPARELYLDNCIPFGQHSREEATNTSAADEWFAHLETSHMFYSTNVITSRNAAVPPFDGQSFGL